MTPESLDIAREHISWLRASGRDVIAIIAQARLALFQAGLRRPRRIRFEAEIEAAFAQAWEATRGSLTRGRREAQ